MNDFPALTGDVVTEAHTRKCAESGHATHTVDGMASQRCPRCGGLKPQATINVAQLSAMQLEAHVRLASWRPAEYRRQAAQLRAGEHEISDALPLHAITETADGMAAEADQLEANAAAAQAELDRRRAAAPKITPGRIA